MAKRKKRSRKSATKSTSVARSLKRNWKDMLISGAGVLAGMAAGKWVGEKIQNRGGSVSGEDLLGLDGDTSKYTTPAIVTALGAVAMTMAKDKILTSVGTGVALAGGAGLVNAVAGKPVVALGEVEQPAMIPGFGSTQIVNYDELPTANELSTTFQEDGYIGDTDVVPEFMAGVNNDATPELL